VGRAKICGGKNKGYPKFLKKSLVPLKKKRRPGVVKKKKSIRGKKRTQNDSQKGGLQETHAPQGKKLGKKSPR